MATATEHFSPASDPGIMWDRVDQDALNLLEQARSIAGIPFQITSNYRSPDHSVAVGGLKNDAHTEIPCTAFDIACSDSSSRLIILRSVLQAGFTRIGVKSNHIHVDASPILPQKVCWVEI